MMKIGFLKLHGDKTDNNLKFSTFSILIKFTVH